MTYRHPVHGLVASVPVVLPAGTKYQVEQSGKLSGMFTLEQDETAVAVGGADTVTMYELTDGREVFVLRANEMCRCETCAPFGGVSQHG